MNTEKLIPHLFRTESRKISSVLNKHFGINHMEIAEDIVSDTFLSALETWPYKGIPENPKAWLYAVAKNKIKNYILKTSNFENNIAHQIFQISEISTEIDLSERNITDSQLQMLFAICHPSISQESQIALALKILCGFGIDEIASAFLTNKETINKRLFRAKEKLKSEKIKIEFPSENKVEERIDTVLLTLYLLFNEGYYSENQDTVIRKDLCFESIRLLELLIENYAHKIPKIHALYALMCFHSSRFDARKDQNNQTVLYQNQDENLWDKALIEKGIFHLHLASKGETASKYHIEASIAYWMTIKQDSKEKWEQVLKLYNLLLFQQYSPIAALNRTFALSKVYGNEIAIAEAEKLKLESNPFYFSLLAELYLTIDLLKAKQNLEKALSLSNSNHEKEILHKKIAALSFQK
ncbi:RNA polymerase sigma factor [Lacihabitans sp. CS3-21]|uniref:RNA polymerase sigma factor n=1 Tax=Lacihabitans sp. CS3-21 TaxID=2487332 RepID=UPI0020CDE1B5|nr:sigma-70 family RNA polymerase sigma factor [Lacihabitans sp. CS3-21]MCP9745997.1 sigma-70 family RNA polymerase sigma factor [Lacihabitans sp. CS3-21]